MKISIKFFGIPEVNIDNKKIELPYIKAYAVLLYLLIEKSTTRDNLSLLIWENMDDSSAKKNLRNALYNIRKTIDENLIISPNRSVLSLNEEYSIETDLNSIESFNSQTTDRNELIEFVNIYKGDFLSGFEFEVGDEFFSWIEETKQEIEKLYTKKLDDVIKNLSENDIHHDILILYLEKAINIDIYNEEYYRKLMNLYIKEENYTQVVNIYNKLSDILLKDLSLKPSPETKKVYENIIGKMYANKHSVFNSTENMEVITKDIKSFKSDSPYSSSIITGEYGLGKSTLLNEIYGKIKGSKDYILIKINSVDYEMKLIFNFWQELFTKGMEYIYENDLRFDNFPIINRIKKEMRHKDLDTIFRDISLYEIMTFDMIEKTVSKIIEKISLEKKIILLIDDIYYVDSLSLNILLRTLNDYPSKLMLIATIEDLSLIENHEYLKVNLDSKNIKILELNKLSLEETKSFLKEKDEKYLNYSQDIFNKTKGNPYYLLELTKILKESDDSNIQTSIDEFKLGIEGFISSKIDKLDKSHKDIIDICSIFRSDIPIMILRNLLAMEDSTLILLLDDLIEDGILRESQGNKDNLSLGFKFSNLEVKEYIYDNISSFKKVLLHEKLSEIYINILENSRENYFKIYTDIIYHYSKSNNKLMEFKYRTLRMENVLRNPGEIFPEVEDLGDEKTFIYVIDKDLLDSEFNKLSQLLEKDLTLNSEKIIDEIIIYLYTYGTYLKTKGNLEEGNRYIEKMLDIAYKTENYDYVFKGLCQFIDISIFSEDYETLDLYLAKLKDIVTIMDTTFENAYYYRINGYRELLKGNYELCREYQYRSIDILEKSIDTRKAILGLAAAYSNIAESYMEEGNYELAEEYYLISTDQLPKYYENIPGAGLMYSRMGIIKYEEELYNEAYFYFTKALKSYRENNFKWNISEIYYYLHLLYPHINAIDSEMSENYLENAINYMDTCMNPKVKEVLKDLKPPTF